MVKNVLDYLEKSAEKYPDKIAYSDKDNNITYAELQKKAQAVGTFLLSNCQKNKPVAVFVDRTVQSVVMFMGVVYSGNFYAPIDPATPMKRIDAMLSVLAPVMIIGGDNSASVIKQICTFKTELYNNICDTPIDTEALKAVRSEAMDSDPVCCIFTSGSTGIPKAVIKSHRSIICMANNFTDTFGFSSEDVFGNQSPFDFDVSNKDIYLTLFNSASNVIIPKEYFVFPIKLIQYMNEKGITSIIWAVSALNVVANIKAMKKEKLCFVKKVLFSGEVLPVKSLEYWMSNLPDAMFVNLYGPTEMTGNVTYYIVDKERTYQNVLPIGRTFPNTRMILAGDDGRIVEGAGEGEAYISGGCLAMGYYNDISKTASSFVQAPYDPLYPEIFYKTGDIVRRDEDGDYIYVGRKDFQIKHQGHRIELQEIEAAANQWEGIKACCCIYDREKQRIVLVYESDRDEEKELLDVLKKTLPKFMLPNRIVRIDKMPMNGHCKIDRRLLMEMSKEGGL